MELSRQQLQAFWSKIDIRGKDDCWIWRGAIQSRGYGSFSIDGKTYNAHRISFMLNNGYMPRLLVLHSCDNRKCVNPAHLREGTQLENVRDMVTRGRANMSGLMNYRGTLD